DVANPHTVREAGAHRLDDRFLGREPHGEEAFRTLRAGELLALCRHEQPVDEMIAEALERLLDASRLEHIDADTVNHGRRIIRETSAPRGSLSADARGAGRHAQRLASSMSWRMSRTAGPMPSNTARAMIAWPMFSSTMSAIAATGCTL